MGTSYAVEGSAKNTVVNPYLPQPPQNGRGDLPAPQP
jgi:hypothetical protein